MAIGEKAFKMKSRGRLWIKIGLLMIAAILLVEGGVKLCGLVDFPLYQIDPDLGYIPQPNQSGAFLRKNRWEFNELSMATRKFVPNQDQDILLLGDSVVIGGNPTDQSERLGTELEKQLAEDHGSVWPVGAASWGALNERAYLEKNPAAIREMEWVVWILNSGDFYQVSRWRDQFDQPLAYPIMASEYLLEKYILQPWVVPRVPRRWREKIWNPAPPPAPYADGAQVLTDYLWQWSQRWPQAKLMIVVFPFQPELIHGYQGLRKVEEGLQMNCVKLNVPILIVSECPEWKPSLYRDESHPSPAGNRVLAQLIARKIKENTSLP